MFGTVNNRTIHLGACALCPVPSVEINISMNMGTTVQNDIATIQLNIPINRSSNNNIAIECNDVSLNHTINSYLSTKSSQIAALRLIGINDNSTAECRPMMFISTIAFSADQVTIRSHYRRRDTDHPCQ